MGSGEWLCVACFTAALVVVMFYFSLVEMGRGERRSKRIYRSFHLHNAITLKTRKSLLESFELNLGKFVHQR